MPTKIDYTGVRMGHLTLLSYSRKGGPGVGAFWKVRCDCGKIKEVIAKEARRGRIKTCGECEYHRKLLSGASTLGGSRNRYDKDRVRNTYRAYIRNALLHDRVMDLTFEQFKGIVLQPCFYCGHHDKRKSNGVDRLDNELGYTLDNCQPCCGPCNRRKGRRNFMQYLDDCIQTVNHFQRQLGRMLVEVVGISPPALPEE